MTKRKKQDDEPGPYAPTTPVDDWDPPTPVDDSTVPPSEYSPTPVDEPEASPTAEEPTTPVDEPLVDVDTGASLTAITVYVDADDLELLSVISAARDEPSNITTNTRATNTLLWFIEIARAGVMRRGSWERGWLARAFSPDFVARLERDPEDAHFDRPRPPPPNTSDAAGSVVEGAPGP